MTLNRFGEYCAFAGHGLAIFCALCGIGMIVVAPLSSVVYGIALLGLAIALDVIVAVNCADSPVGIRRKSHPRVTRLHTRKHPRHVRAAIGKSRA